MRDAAARCAHTGTLACRRGQAPSFRCSTAGAPIQSVLKPPRSRSIRPRRCAPAFQATQVGIQLESADPAWFRTERRQESGCVTRAAGETPRRRFPRDTVSMVVRRGLLSGSLGAAQHARTKIMRQRMCNFKCDQRILAVCASSTSGTSRKRLSTRMCESTSRTLRRCGRVSERPNSSGMLRASRASHCTRHLAYNVTARNY